MSFIDNKMNNVVRKLGGTQIKGIVGNAKKGFGGREYCYY